MKTVKPTAHYSIRIPDDTHQELDEEVLGLWKEGDGTLLQVSSKVRVEGEQVSAEQRLADRMRVRTWSRIELGCDADCEVAAATTAQGEYVWWHIYLVVPYVAVYSTISFPASAHVSDWALGAVRSIRFGNPVTLIS
jgi:hypothetical protein